MPHHNSVYGTADIDLGARAARRHYDTFINLTSAVKLDEYACVHVRVRDALTAVVPAVRGVGSAFLLILNITIDLRADDHNMSVFFSLALTNCTLLPLPLQPGCPQRYAATAGACPPS